MPTAFHIGIFTVKLNSNYKAVSIHETEKWWKTAMEERKRPQNNFKSSFALLPIQIPVLSFEGFFSSTDVCAP